jgi:hypothetical protein
VKKTLVILFHWIALLAVVGALAGCGSAGTPMPASPTLPEANVTCNELSFYLDPALGSGGACTTVPENATSDIPMYYVFIYPGHTELTIENYPLTGTQFPPQIWIYPVDRFSELLPEHIPSHVSDLQNLIANGAGDSAVLPFLPVIPQTQSFHIFETGLSFNGGQGLRFITEYSESPTPINSKCVIYTFQGLTTDGRYWVAVTLPIGNSILPATNDMLPEGYTDESLIQGYAAYVREVKAALEAQPLDSFFPAIDSLDNLVRSISVNP